MENIALILQHADGEEEYCMNSRGRQTYDFDSLEEAQEQLDNLKTSYPENNYYIRIEQ